MEAKAERKSVEIWNVDPFFRENLIRGNASKYKLNKREIKKSNIGLNHHYLLIVIFLNGVIKFPNSGDLLELLTAWKVSECGKIRTRRTLKLDIFQAMCCSLLLSSYKLVLSNKAEFPLSPLNPFHIPRKDLPEQAKQIGPVVNLNESAL